MSAINITGDGVTTGLGALSFYDSYTGTYLRGFSAGLYIRSRGDDGGTYGSVTSYDQWQDKRLL